MTKTKRPNKNNQICYKWTKDSTYESREKILLYFLVVIMGGLFKIFQKQSPIVVL